MLALIAWFAKDVSGVSAYAPLSYELCNCHRLPPVRPPPLPSDWGGQEATGRNAQSVPVPLGCLSDHLE